MFCYRSAPRNIFFALFSPHTFFLLLFRPKSRVIWRWQVARHTVHVVPPVVCAKCGNFCENKALFTDLGIFKRKIYIFPPQTFFFRATVTKHFLFCLTLCAGNNGMHSILGLNFHWVWLACDWCSYIVIL